MDTSADVPPAVEASTLVLGDLRAHAALLTKFADTKVSDSLSHTHTRTPLTLIPLRVQETRFVQRVLRHFLRLRREVTASALLTVVRDYIPQHVSSLSVLSTILAEAGGVVIVPATAAPAAAPPTAPEKSDAAPVAAVAKPEPPAVVFSPELDLYLHLLTIVLLLDAGNRDQALLLSTRAVDLMLAANRRTLDKIAARVLYFHARLHELAHSLSAMRPLLQRVLRSATLHADHELQAVATTTLLRSLLSDSLYEQADMLVKRSTFPQSASNNEWARFLYYVGRIKAVQLEYSEAHKNLTVALRKAPQNAAVGFQQAATKLLVIVQLLMGDLPERSVFRTRGLELSLQPYLKLAVAVRAGTLEQFAEVLATYSAVFRRDGNASLVMRLRHNVIKAGIRSINQSYSRISVGDVCSKLKLDSVDDAEYILAKSVRDGVIDAHLDHEHGWMETRDRVDIYATSEPQAAFDERIKFCLALHNDAVKAMTFPEPKRLAGIAGEREHEADDPHMSDDDMESDMDSFL
jgi:26S proteasome regulatory subunit N3